MLEDILEKVKSELGGDLMSKFGLDKGQTDKAISITGDTLKKTISKESTGGGMEGIMNLFSASANDESGNSMLDKIGGDLISKFSSSLGIDESKAAGIKDMIMSKVTSLFGDKLGSNFDISSLLSMVTGGGDAKGGGASGILGKLTGFFGKK
jgi:hypothetical protein|tara:strand:- start:43912 stop:44367 length:456 start_codon:yes stop_codon:yes gene_type:complete